MTNYTDRFQREADGWFGGTDTNWYPEYQAKCNELQAANDKIKELSTHLTQEGEDKCIKCGSKEDTRGGHCFDCANADPIYGINSIIKNVYNPIHLKTNDGEDFYICMRDSGYEFTYQGKKYEAKNGLIRKMGKEEGKDIRKDAAENKEEVKCIAHGACNATGMCIYPNCLTPDLIEAENYYTNLWKLKKEGIDKEEETAQDAFMLGVQLERENKNIKSKDNTVTEGKED